MPYILSGTFEDVLGEFEPNSLFTAENPQNVEDGGDDSIHPLIAKDIDRFNYLGSPDDYQLLYNGWQKNFKNVVKKYVQGDLAGDNAYLVLAKQKDELNLDMQLLGPPIEDEPEEESALDFSPNQKPSRNLFMRTQIRTTSFAFVDNKGILSSIGLYYDPKRNDRWILTIEKNINLSRSERALSLITSFSISKKDNKDAAKDEFTFRRLANDNPVKCELKEIEGSEQVEDLINVIDHPLVAGFVQSIVPYKKINPNADLISLFCNTKNSNTIDLAMLEGRRWTDIFNNPALRAIKNLEQKVSPNQLLDCLNRSKPLYDFFSSLVHEEKTPELAKKVKVYVWFDQWGIQEQFASIKDNQRFIGTLTSALEFEPFYSEVMANQDKFNSILFITNESTENFTNIMSSLESNKENPAVWQALNDLTKLQWNYPQHQFAHTVLCHLAINSPNKPEITQELINKISSLGTLSSKINPIKLALQIADKDWNSNLASLLAFSAVIPEDSVQRFEESGNKKRQKLEVLFNHILTHDENTLEFMKATLAVVNSEKSSQEIKKLLKEESSNYKMLSAISPMAVFASLGIEQNYEDLALKGDPHSEFLQNLVNSVEPMLWSASTANSELPKKQLRITIYSEVLKFLNASAEDKSTLAIDLMQKITEAEQQFNAEANFDDINKQIALLLNPLDGQPELINLMNLVPAKLSLLMDKQRFDASISKEGDINEQFSHALAASLEVDDPLAAERLEVIFSYILSNTKDDHKSALLEKAHHALQTKSITELAAEINAMKRQGNNYSLLLDAVATTNTFAQLNIDKLPKEVFSPEVKGKVLRKVVKVLDVTLDKTQTELPKSTDKKREMSVPEQVYRKAMYEAVTVYLNAPSENRKAAYEKLEEATENSLHVLLKITDKDRRPALRIAAMIVTNLVSILLTAGISNLVHYRNTGDVLFKSSTKTSEDIKRADIKVLRELKSIKPSGPGG